MKDRISRFLIDENISPAEFADKIGVQRSSVSHVLNGRNYPSAAFIQKMLKAYTNLNPRWLILGAGNVYETPRKSPDSELLFSNTGHAENKNTYSAGSSTTESLKTPIIDNNKPEEKDMPGIITEEEKRQGGNDNYKTFTEESSIERIVVFYKDKTFKEYKPAR